MSKPNIFEIGTKELHQDAFLTWLILWADPTNEQFDAPLHACAQEFVRVLIMTQERAVLGKISEVKAGRQWENIDVWAEVSVNGSKYLIILEDKTFSSEHSDQLTAYKNVAEDYSSKHGFSLICVYLKTGNEPEGILKGIRAKGFATYGRKDFLELLDRHTSVKNEIFSDFKGRLKRIENDYAAFETTLIGEWDDSCWIGFYHFLEREINITYWGKVNNPAGGFWNAGITEWRYKRHYALFLQIEQGKVCFKLCTDPNEVNFDDGKIDRSEFRDKLSGRILQAASKHGLSEARRPDRFGKGKYMTIAVIDTEVWLGSQTTVIEKALVVKNLKRYQDFFSEFV